MTTATFIGSSGDPDAIPFALASSTAEFKELAAVVRRMLHEEDYLLSGSKTRSHPSFGAWPVDGLGTLPRFLLEGEIRWVLNPTGWAPARAVVEGTQKIDPYGVPSAAIQAERASAALLPAEPSTFWRDTGAPGGDQNPGPIAPPNFIAPAPVRVALPPLGAEPYTGPATRFEGMPLYAGESPILAALTVTPLENPSVPLPVALEAVKTILQAAPVAMAGAGATTLSRVGTVGPAPAAIPTGGPTPKGLSPLEMIVLALGLGVCVVMLMQGKGGTRTW